MSSEIYKGVMGWDGISPIVPSQPAAGVQWIPSVGRLKHRPILLASTNIRHHLDTMIFAAPRHEEEALVQVVKAIQLCTGGGDVVHPESNCLGRGATHLGFCNDGIWHDIRLKNLHFSRLL